MPITTLPAVPTIDDPQNFATEADAFLGALPTFVTEANALAAQVQNNATTASTAATSATTAASTASAAVTTAANSATSAAGSASSASTSATNAAASASTATTQATNAATSATNAITSAASASAIVTSSASNRPSIRPSLLLDFSNTKSLDPRITFARNSIGTYFGNLQHKCEENVLTYSEQFDNAIWSKLAVSVTANSVTAPDGTNNADTVTADGNSATHVIFYNNSSTSGVTRTFSVYAKAGTNSFIQLLFFGDAQVYANFNISTGVIGGTGSNTTAAIASVGNSWYRCSITTSSATATASANVYLVTSNTSARAESNTLSTSVYLWGAQVEYRNFAGGYIGTTTTPVSTYMTTLLQANANIPRFDHDPITGESKGFFVEETRTNLLTYSSDFSNANWGKGSSPIISNYIIAPDGTLTADKIVLTNGSTFGYVFRVVTIQPNTTYTLSFYAKAGERYVVNPDIYTAETGDIQVTIDLLTGIVSFPVNSPDSYGATYVGNGWYRCWITKTFGATVTNSQVQVGRQQVTGNGTSGLYIWGAQLEVGSFPSSYIPTTTSTVARASEVAYISGTNFSTWYRQDEGTAYIDYDVIGLSTSTGRPFTLLGGSSSLVLRVGNIINGSDVCSSNSGVAQVDTNSIGITPNTFARDSLAIKTNDLAWSHNGAVVITDTSCTFPTAQPFDRVDFGLDYFSGHIRRFAYYPKRLTNTELQTLST